MEIATLFFCRSSDLYLNDRGIIAFVMPRSVLTGAFHHVKFKNFKKPRMKLYKILDLENVSPLFNVPSCVLIALKNDETTFPVLARRYTGQLPEKNIRLVEAVKYLVAEDYSYESPILPTGYSCYHNRVKQGATIVPRNLWFIDFDVHRILGVNISKPLVKTADDVQRRAKRPWKGVSSRGNVEAGFIYATILGGDIVSFGYVKLRPVVLPVEPTATNYKPLDVDLLKRRGYTYMAEWLEKAQEFWEEYATRRALSDHPRVISWLDYRRKLTNQNPSKRYIVLYNTSGTNLVSCVIDRHSLPSFHVLRATIQPKGFVADAKTYFYETNNENEAYYLCAVLNSNIVNDAIKPLQTKGLFGERDIHRRPFMFPIPQFDRNNPSHFRLVELSKKCHAKISSARFTKKSTAGRREEAREVIKEELREIDELVVHLLGLK
jgi:hypothetical protein